MPKRRSKPRTALFEPEEEQFKAQVQGIYESLVKKHLRRRSTTPFRDSRGQRLDVKALLPAEKVRELLSNAFAIATRSGQRYGYLQPGSQKPTRKGRKRAQERLSDVEKLRQNQQDYEETLSLARKGSEYRIVYDDSRARPWVVQPSGKRYRREQDAKAAITRLERRNNPDFSRTFQSLASSGPRYRKPQRSVHAQAVSQAEFAREAGITPEQARRRMRGGRRPEDFQAPIALITERVGYLPWMLDGNGEPYLIYTLAPLCRFYTVELYGSRPAFETFRKGQYIAKFDERLWESTSWGGYKSAHFKSPSYRQFKSKSGEPYWKAIRKDDVQRVSLNYRVGSGFTRQQGFNEQAISESTLAIQEAYDQWYPDIEVSLNVELGIREIEKKRGRKLSEKELKKERRKLADKEKKKKKEEQDKDLLELLDEIEITFPDDVLRPKYPVLDCDGVNYDVLDPMVHVGVLLRACAALVHFMELNEQRTGGKFRSVDISAVINFLTEKNLLEEFNRIFEESGIGSLGSGVLKNNRNPRHQAPVSAGPESLQNLYQALQQVGDMYLNDDDDRWHALYEKIEAGEPNFLQDAYNQVDIYLTQPTPSRKIEPRPDEILPMLEGLSPFHLSDGGHSRLIAGIYYDSGEPYILLDRSLSRERVIKRFKDASGADYEDGGSNSPDAGGKPLFYVPPKRNRKRAKRQLASRRIRGES